MIVMTVMQMMMMLLLLLMVVGVGGSCRLSRLHDDIRIRVAYDFRAKRVVRVW